jgi:molybdopterin synthase catalytic subunit
VQTVDFDIGAEIAEMRRGNPKVGAVASFIGVVRDLNEGDRVAEMTLEHYPGMTEKALEKMVAEARSRWDIYDALIIHRVGTLQPGDQIVLVVVTGAPRRGLRLANSMDYLSPARVLKERSAGVRWVEARESDGGRDRWT